MLKLKGGIGEADINLKDWGTLIPLIDTLACDVCGKGYKAADFEGADAEAAIGEAQEFTLIRHHCGYGADGQNTVFRDDLRYSADLCQHCLNRLLGPYMRKSDRFPVTNPKELAKHLSNTGWEWIERKDCNAAALGKTVGKRYYQVYFALNPSCRDYTELIRKSIQTMIEAEQAEKYEAVIAEYNEQKISKTDVYHRILSLAENAPRL